jgi:L-asparagine transporter-like permease
VRVAAFLGDLGNPFYREERQRDVWNEASAVALQVVLVLSLLAETAAVWIIGADALPYVYALLGIVGIASWIAILYARSLGVHADDPQRMWRPRMIPYLAVLALLVVGLVHATAQDTSSDDWSTITGMVTGVALAVAGSLYARKRLRAREEE